jgi:hypothetical protein
VSFMAARAGRRHERRLLWAEAASHSAEALTWAAAEGEGEYGVGRSESRVRTGGKQPKAVAAAPPFVARRLTPFWSTG